MFAELSFLEIESTEGLSVAAEAERWVTDKGQLWSDVVRDSTTGTTKEGCCHQWCQQSDGGFRGVNHIHQFVIGPTYVFTTETSYTKAPFDVLL